MRISQNRSFLWVVLWMDVVDKVKGVLQSQADHLNGKETKLVCSQLLATTIRSSMYCPASGLYLVKNSYQ